MRAENLNAPGLLSHRRYSPKLLESCEQDKVRVNVDIHTLVQELRDKVDMGMPRDN